MQFVPALAFGFLAPPVVVPEKKEDGVPVAENPATPE